MQPNFGLLGQNGDAGRFNRLELHQRSLVKDPHGTRNSGQIGPGVFAGFAGFGADQEKDLVTVTPVLALIQVENLASGFGAFGEGVQLGHPFVSRIWCGRKSDGIGRHGGFGISVPRSGGQDDQGGDGAHDKGVDKRFQARHHAFSHRFLGLDGRVGDRCGALAGF